MLYFVPHGPLTYDGGSRAGVDILRSLVAGGAPTTVVSDARFDVGAHPDAEPTEDVRWLLPPVEDWLRPSAPLTLRNRAGQIVRLARHPDRNRAFHRAVAASRDGVFVFNDLSGRAIGIFRALRGRAATVHVVHASVTCARAWYRSPPFEDVVRTYAATSRLVFVSERCKDGWLALPDLAGKPHDVIPNCADEDAIARLVAQPRAEVRRGLELEADRFVLACVGSLQPRKAQDVIVEALPGLAAALPDPLVVFVGQANGDYQSRLEARVAELGMERHVRFVGPRDDALAFTYAADALLLASRSEALPLVILEAMALRTPVAATAVAGVPEMIVPRETGFSFEPDDVDGLVAACTELHRDQATRTACTERAHARYWNQFSRAHHRQRYRQLVEDLCPPDS